MMMKLSTMQKLVTTLNENDESPIANEIASRWEHDPGSVRFLRASANFLFLFKHAGKDYVLRFVNADERTFNTIRAELAYLDHLALQGVHVAKPVRSLAGNFVEDIATDQGFFHAVAFKRLAGEQYELSDLTPAKLTRWGQALGELHTAAKGYCNTGRATWKDDLALVAARLPVDEPAARATMEQVQEQLTQLPVHNDNFGLIHFDFELDNVIWNDHQVGVVDFDDSAYYWFVADIAFALRDAFDDSAEKVNLQNEIAHHFINGYRTVRSIDTEELARIPLFLKLHNLITFAKLHHTLESDEQQEKPEWVAKLQNKLHTKIASYRDEFAKTLE